MRLLATCILLVVVLQLAIHNVSASPVDPVEQGNQVNQGQNDLSKGENATCPLFSGKNSPNHQVPIGKWDRLYTLVAKAASSDIACKITDFVTRFSASSDPCRLTFGNPSLAYIKAMEMTVELVKARRRGAANRAAPKNQGTQLSVEERAELEGILLEALGTPSNELTMEFVTMYRDYMTQFRRPIAVFQSNFAMSILRFKKTFADICITFLKKVKPGDPRYDAYVEYASDDPYGTNQKKESGW